jgi:3-oxoacid CoA-transferase B subunit
MPLTREQIARRIAEDLPDGSYVNLGIGIPTLCGNYIPREREVILHSENGVLGYGPRPAPGHEDASLINAGKEFVTLLPGGSFCHQADSFSMTRGRHVDIAVLGGMQVSARGDLANWKIPGEPMGAIGGAMDIAAGARQVFVAMTHVTTRGEPKIVDVLSYPVTALKCVTRIYTDIAVIEVLPQGGGLLLTEVAPGYTAAQVQAATGPRLAVAPGLRTMAPTGAGTQ